MAEQPLRVITQTESWKQEVQADAVRLLEEWLAMAKSGELQGVALAGVRIGERQMTAFSKSENRNILIAGMTQCTYRMCRMMDEEA